MNSSMTPTTGASRETADVLPLDWCPCCGQYAPVSSIIVLIGQVDHAGYSSLVPRCVCFSCAQASPEHRFALSLDRQEPLGAAVDLVLSFLVREDKQSTLVAEHIVSTFPERDESMPIRAVGHQVALLVRQLLPSHFTWISRFLSQGDVIAVGLAPVVYTDGRGRCSCGHLLRSPLEREHRQCLECRMEASYSQEDYTK